MSNIPPPVPPVPPPYSPLPPQPLPYQAPSAYGVTVPCPHCGDVRSKKGSFTWWGGALGPKLFSHVKCLGCGFGYNGKTGRPNTKAIAIYTIIGLVIGVVAGVIFFLSRSH